MRLISTSVAVPVVAIWFLGLYGYQRLSKYASYVADSPEGRHVMQLTRGICIITVGLPITSTLGAVCNLLAQHHHNLLAPTTVVNNFVALILSLAGFWYVSKAGRGLSERVKQRPKQVGVHLLALVLIIVGVTYGYLVAAARNDIYHIFHMPLVLVMITLVIPYIFSWYLGLLAANDLHTYTLKVKGAVFRRGWNMLAFGVIWLIVFSVVLQYLSSVSVKLSNIPLGWILALVYGILAIRVVGYLLVASGAKRLTKIEEA